MEPGYRFVMPVHVANRTGTSLLFHAFCIFSGRSSDQVNCSAITSSDELRRDQHQPSNRECSEVTFTVASFRIAVKFTLVFRCQKQHSLLTAPRQSRGACSETEQSRVHRHQRGSVIAEWRNMVRRDGIPRCPSGESMSHRIGFL